MTNPDHYNEYKQRERTIERYIAVFLVLFILGLCGGLASLSREEADKCHKSKCPIDMTPQFDHGVCRCYVMLIGE
jgi:hypothetical protein